MNTKKQDYNFITNEEIEEKIKNHLLILRWAKWLDDNLSWYDFADWVINEWTDKEENFYVNKDVFQWRNLEKINFEKSNFLKKFDFSKSNLKEANFKNADLSNWANFYWADLEWADFRNANFNTSIFSWEQEKNIILTDEDYKKYQEKKKLEEQNKKLKKEVKNKDKIIKDTSEKQTNKLTESFEILEKQFLLEEKRWLFISFIIFICLFLYVLIPVLDLFSYKYMPKILILLFMWILYIIFLTIFLFFKKEQINKRKKYFHIKNLISVLKNIWVLLYNIKNILYEFLIFWMIALWIMLILDKVDISNKSLFNWDWKYSLLPLWILLSTFLYFSIYQYSKSKKLRIENSNKIALLHWYIAIKTEKSAWINKWRFYDKVADVVFSKVYEWKETNLPIDKLIDIIKIIDKK